MLLALAAPFAVPMGLVVLLGLSALPAHAQQTATSQATASQTTTSQATASAASICAEARRFPAASVIDTRADLARVGQLTGWLPLRTHTARRAGTEPDLILCDRDAGYGAGRGPGSDWLALDDQSGVVTLLPVRWRSVANSAYPRGGNQGALWGGRGFGTIVEGGVRLRLGPLSAAFAPELVYQQNRPFETRVMTAAGHSAFVYPDRPTNIDWPQRFGEEPLRMTGPGQSYARLDLFGLAAGVSNENLWWGPGQRYPLLMSANAPGFPHIFVGTGRPFDLYIGTVEVEAIWGRLDESDHFDLDAENDGTLFSGILASFSPRGVPGLSVGVARSFLTYYDQLSTKERLLKPYVEVRDNPLGRNNPDADNQLLSVFGRWAVPGAGFEIYGEWAREDHWADFEHLLAAPDMSQAYMVGFQQVVPRGRGFLRLTGELVQLEDALPINHAFRTIVRYYTHGQIRPGYTHRGQILGAYIGPDANAQYLAGDYFSPDGRIGVFFERVRRGGDQYTVRWSREHGSAGHDLELTAGVRHLRHIGPLDLHLGLSYSQRSNRNHLGMLESPPRRLNETNWGLQFGVGWRPHELLRSHAPRPEPSSTPWDGGADSLDEPGQR